MDLSDDVVTAILLADEQLPQWLNAVLGPLGLLVFLLIIVVYGGTKHLWVFGWVYDETQRRLKMIEADRDYWRNMAVKSLNVGQDAVKAAVKIAPERSLEEMAKTVDEARRRGEIE